MLKSAIKFTKKHAAFAAAFLFLPVIVFAHTEAGAVHPHLTLLTADIQCGGADCGFDNLLLLIQGLLSFLITLAIPVASAMFIYAGFLYVTAIDDSGKVSKAKGIFATAFWGFVIMLGAWLIVYTIVIALVDPVFLQEGNGDFFRFLNIN